MMRVLFLAVIFSLPTVAAAQDIAPLADPPSPSAPLAPPPVVLPAPAPPPQPMPAPYPWAPPPYAAYPPPYPYPYPYAVAPAPQAPSPTPAIVEPPEPPYTGPAPSRTSWALALESAHGVATGSFQNTLLGGHVDYRFGTRTSLGGYLALANLKGKDGRVSSLLPCALVTYEKPRPGHALSFPLQFSTGYLVENGPVARLAAGLAWGVGRRTDLVFSLASMAWVTRDDMLLSLNLAVELRFRAP